jgi:hypothetical protein
LEIWVKLRIPWVKILILLALFIGTSAFGAEDSAKVLSFQEWKGNQVVEAKNQVARLSNRITLLKKGVLKEDNLIAEDPSLTDQLSSDRLKSAKGRNLVSKMESQLKSALENLQFTTELSLQDYFAVYLSRFKDQPEAISTAADKLSKDEILELLKIMLKSDSGDGEPLNNAAQLRGALVGSLSAKSL